MPKKKSPLPGKSALVGFFQDMSPRERANIMLLASAVGTVGTAMVTFEQMIDLLSRGRDPTRQMMVLGDGIDVAALQKAAHEYVKADLAEIAARKKAKRARKKR